MIDKSFEVEDCLGLLYCFCCGSWASSLFFGYVADVRVSNTHMLSVSLILLFAVQTWLLWGQLKYITYSLSDSWYQFLIGEGVVIQVPWQPVYWRGPEWWWVFLSEVPGAVLSWICMWKAGVLKEGDRWRQQENM